MTTDKIMIIFLLFLVIVGIISWIYFWKKGHEVEMGRMADEYKDIKLQQEYVSKTIDNLWKMAQKYQKIEQIMKSKKMDALDSGLLIPKDMACVLHEIKEVIENGNVD